MVALSLFAFSACKGTEPEEPETQEPALSVVKSTLAIPAKGGEATIDIKSEGVVLAKTDASWLNVSVDGKKVIASAEANLSLQSRYAQVVVNGSGESVTLTVQQFGMKTTGFAPEDITVDYHAAKVVYNYDYDEMLEASCDASWITLDVTENALNIAIAQDATEATISDKQRTAVISWSLGMDSGEIAVVQHHQNFMQADPNWTVSYLGVQDYKGDMVEEIQNTVAQPGISGKYAITYVDKYDFISSGLTIEAYVENTVAADLAAEIGEMISYYSALLGLDLTFGDFLYEDTDFEIFDILESGEYIGIAIGYDDEGNATGHFASAEFKKEGAVSNYDSWLGEWISVCGSKTNTWVIAQKEKGKTYTINGIDGITNAPIEAEFDSSNNSLIVRVQDELGTYTSNNYGEMSLGFYGSYTNADGGSSFYKVGSTPYVIFTAKQVDEKTATLTGVPYETSSGTVNFEHAKYIGTTSEGKYVSIRSNADTTPLPGTITRKDSGSGGGDGGNGSAAYNKWLGSWNVSSGNGDFTISIAKKEADKSYNVTGWQMKHEDYMSPMTALFNADGTLTFCGNTVTPFATNIALTEADGSDDPDNPYDFCYVAKILYQGTEYYITDESGDYEVAKATLAASGTSATIAGLPISLNIGEIEACRLEILAFSQKNEKSIYGFNGKPSEFPLTMSKASGSSVKSNSVKDNSLVKVYNASFMYEPMLECTPVLASGRQNLAAPRVTRKINK